MNIRPIKNDVLICLDPVKQLSPGMIWLPEQAREKPQLGTVVDASTEAVKWLIKAYGEDCMGRRVVCPSHAGTVVESNGEAHLIVNAKDILGLL